MLNNYHLHGIYNKVIMYLLPWEEFGPNTHVRREATGRSRFIFARVDHAAGMFIAKSAYEGGTTNSTVYSPSAMSFYKIGSFNSKEEAMSKVDEKLLEQGCKFIDKKLLVMI